MTDSSLATHLRNLDAQIKYNQVSMASWGGQKNFKKAELPSVDFLLNNASNLNKEQTKRQKMVDEYLQKQKVPIERNGIKYKFHNIPEPVLDLNNQEIIIIEPETGMQRTIPITPDEFESVLNKKNDFILEIKKAAREFLVNLNNDMEAIKEERKNKEIELKLLIGEKDELEKQLRDPGRLIKEVKDRNVFEFGGRKKRTKQNASKLRDELNLVEERLDNMKRDLDIIKERIDDKQDEIIDLDREKERLENLYSDIQRNEDQALEQLNITTARIKNQINQNKTLVENYQSELNRINNGAFNSEKGPNESDSDYIERLNRMADVPFDNANTQQLAVLEQKEQLRERLLELIRDRSIIEGIVNRLQNIDFLDIYTLNKSFELFKRNFLKKYGYDNKNLKLIDILEEIEKYLRKLSEIPEQNQLIPFNNPQQPQNYPINPSVPVFNVDLGSSQPIPLQTEETIDPEEEEFTEYSFAIPPEDNRVLLENSFMEITKVNEYTIRAFSKNNGASLWFRYKDPNTGKLSYDTYEDGTKKKNKAGITFTKSLLLYSLTGEPRSFENFAKLSSSEPYNIIKDHLELTDNDIRDMFGSETVKTKANITQEFLNLMKHIGIMPSPEEGFIKNRVSGNAGIVGEGLSNHKKHEKVKFGDIILMLNKLFYHNILSISRPDGVKINGWKNKHVSDEFVMCVVNMLDHKNYQKELNKLSSSEKVLLDNLLSVANLHKKVITGTGNDSIKKLKNDLQILEGEIQAGNNNESLKKKLHDILHKLAYFKVISLSQATKHYKEYLKNFF